MKIALGILLCALAACAAAPVARTPAAVTVPVTIEDPYVPPSARPKHASRDDVNRAIDRLILRLRELRELRDMSTQPD